MLVPGYLNQSISGDYRTDVRNQEYFQKPSEDPKCIDCHNELIENKILHDPAKESCENCHQINIKDHSENNVKGLNLAEKVPDLCFICHDGLKSGLDTLRNVHQAINNKKSCTYCHSPHSSKENKLLVMEQKNLCLTCHNKDVSTNGRKPVNIKKLLDNSKFIHPALESDGCVVCHQPHGSSNNYLLISSFPAGNYSPAKIDNYAICWECHDSDLFKVEKTITATSFRDGERNLHFVHLNGDKGKSCIMCHNVHASMNEHLIEDKVQFGEWELPIKYVPQKDGGSCFPGCHAEKTYTR